MREWAVGTVYLRDILVLRQDIALYRPANGMKLVLTHSGAESDKATIYTTSGANPVPVHSGEVTVGLNPFGLAFVP